MANDKKESKTVWLTLDTTLYYAQVFEENRDKGDMHSDTDGITKVTLKLTDDQINELMGLGVPETALGYATFKDVTIDGENFRAYVAKRPWVSKYLKDEAGEPQKMGAPKVFMLADAMAKAKEAESWRILDEHKTFWTMKDGLIGNGTTAKVKLSIYRGKNKAGKPTCVVMLEEIAIVDYVPYVAADRDNDEVVF